MINPGLTVSERRSFNAALAQSHRMRTIIKIRDQDEKIISSFTSRSILLSGAVQVDMTQNPTRTLDLQVLKPTTRTSWAPMAPHDAAIFADNFISVTRGVFVDALDTWVDVPIFWGPVTGASDDGDQLSIAAKGKEIRGTKPYAFWRTMKLGASTQRVQAIRDILDVIGETRYGMPEHSAKMGKPKNLGRYAEPWHTSWKIARGFPTPRQLFYDGDGRVQIRVPPATRQWKVAPGDNSMMLTKPKLDYDISSVRNVVEVLGKDPVGKRPRIRAVAYAPSWHPLSPESLSRNGKRTIIVETIENDLTTTAAALAYARRRLDEFLVAATNITVDVIPIIHLEGGDLVGVEVNGAMVNYRANQFTIPLSGADPMTLGANKRVSWRKAVKK